MKKLAGIVIFAVIIIILGSQTNILGYQMVKTSQNIEIKTEISQKELLLQTIHDLVNNKEIQRTIIKSQMKEAIFNPNTRFSTNNTPLTMSQLKKMYLIGMIFSRIIDKSKIYLMAEKNRINQNTINEINAIIGKNVKLKNEITQFTFIDTCNCGNSNITWNFPIICTILFPIALICFISIIFHSILYYLTIIIGYIGILLHCFWSID
jgi:hypothetical protein